MSSPSPQPYNHAEYLNINYRHGNGNPPSPSFRFARKRQLIIGLHSFRSVGKGACPGPPFWNERTSGFKTLWRPCFSAFSSLMAALRPPRETCFDRSLNLSDLDLPSILNFQVKIRVVTIFGSIILSVTNVWEEVWMWEDLKSFFFFSEEGEDNWEEYQSSSGETNKNLYF